MADFALPALAAASAALLVAAGFGHLRQPAALRLALDAQDLLAHPLRPVVAAGLGLVEVTVGAAAALTLLADGPRSVGLAVAALGAAFLALLVTLLDRRPGAPCGCDGGAGHPVGRADLVRAGTVLAGGGALLAGASSRFADLGGPERATALLAGVALALAADLVGRAHRPDPAPVPP